jgi:hypothetical protein
LEDHPGVYIEVDRFGITAYSGGVSRDFANLGSAMLWCEDRVSNS